VEFHFDIGIFKETRAYIYIAFAARNNFPLSMSNDGIEKIIFFPS
jgi:hypothetical protein